MDDSRRVIVAIGLTLAIFLGWQYLIKLTHPVEEGAPPEASAPAAPATETPRPEAAAPAAGTPAAPGGKVEAAPAPGAPPKPETTASFATTLLAGKITSRGALQVLDLVQYQEDTPDGKKGPVALVTAAADAATAPRQAVLELEAGGAPLVLDFAEQGPRKFVLTGENASGVKARVTVSVREDAYALDYALVLENTAAAAVPAKLTVGMGLTPHALADEGSIFTPPADQVSDLCAVGDKVHRYTASDAATPQTMTGATFAGLDRQYFVVALMPDAPGECVARTKDKSLLVDYALGGADIPPGKSWEKRFTFYVGPKRDEQLSAVAPQLTAVVDYNIWGIPLGFLARPMVAILNFFHGWTTSWGVAIMLLTLLVKTLLFPVTYKSALSMRRMQLVKPELDKLKERFGNDKERMQMEQMKLFREKGVNPLGGCLPMLLQMPVWLALYRMLWTSVDLYQQKFLWLDNLTAKEPFPFLAIAFGLLTMLQQKLTPTTMDSQQAKIMMYVMPVVFTFFMFGLPSGLVLYIVVNSILTIIQQLVINKRQVTL